MLQSLMTLLDPTVFNISIHVPQHDKPALTRIIKWYLVTSTAIVASTTRKLQQPSFCYTLVTLHSNGTWTLFSDVFPIENRDSLLLCYFTRGVISIPKPAALPQRNGPPLIDWSFRLDVWSKRSMARCQWLVFSQALMLALRLTTSGCNETCKVGMERV